LPERHCRYSPASPPNAFVWALGTTGRGHRTHLGGLELAQEVDLDALRISAEGALVEKVAEYEQDLQHLLEDRRPRDGAGGLAKQKRTRGRAGLSWVCLDHTGGAETVSVERGVGFLVVNRRTSLTAAMPSRSSLAFSSYLSLNSKVCSRTCTAMIHHDDY
jgi:hypothetical protein